MADLRAAYLQIDADGRLLATFGPPGTDRPALRRAQALAGQTDVGFGLSRWLVDAKLAGQLVTLSKFANLTPADEAVEAIESYRSAVADAQTMEELRVAEAWSARAYWQALAPLQVRFARRDEGRVPSHWRTFGGRSSPLANGPRLAANPANAVLNYLYALLEAEATLAARIVGLDPGLGVMHVDQVYRDSLAADLMEPVRPAVDAYAFELLTSRPFAARDFFETRAGVCRVTPPLTHELAGTIPRWGQLVGRVAEDFAARLDPSGMRPERTPINGRRRAEGRPTGPRPSAPTAPPKGRACSWCGGPVSSGRQTCRAACAQKINQGNQERFVALGGSSDLVLVGAQGRSDRYVWTGTAFTPPPGVQRTLVHNADYTFTATDKDQVGWIFDPYGRLTQIADRHGNVSNLTYDSNGQLSSISDPAGRGSLTLGYTGGLLTSLTDWASPARVVVYQYDGNGRLWKVTDREGKTTTFGYDGTTQRLTTITDPRGNVAMTVTYDGQGRVATQKDARGLVTGDVTTFGYVVNPDQTRVTTVTAPATSLEPSFLPTLIDSYDANGWLVQRQTTPSSTETLTQTFTYDTEGNRASVTDARGNRTDFCYDVDYAGVPIADADNLTRLIDPPPTPGASRPVTLFSYDAKNNMIQTVAPKGVPSGQTVTCSTDLSAVLTAYVVDYTFDAAQAKLLSRTTRFTDPDLGLQTAITKYEYNDAANPGLITRLIPPRGNTGPTPDYAYATSLSYFITGTRAGMFQDLTDPLGNKTSYDYDPVGRLISSLDPLGNAAGGVPSEHTTFFNWDKEDRLRFRTLPAPIPGGGGLVTETRYDEVGNPTVRIDANGQVTTFAYDNRNSLSQVTESPLAWSDPVNPPATVIVAEYAYDAGGNPTRVTRATGDSPNERVVEYIYDGRGLARLETQYPAWPSTSGSLVTAYTYDANGNRLTLLDPLGGTTTYGYDALDRLASIDYSSAGTPDVAYAYDAHGNRTSMTDGTGATTYTYDEADRLLSVTNPGPKTVGYRYDLNGNRTKLTYPDATAVTYTFNVADQLGTLTDWASRSVAYTYWPDSLVKTATNPNGSVASYGYDNARRLNDIVHTDPTAATIDRFAYTLDGVGNVSSVGDGGSLAAQFGRPDGLAGSNGTWTGTYASIDEVTPSDADYLASPSGPTTSHYYEVTLSDVAEPYTRTGIVVRYRYAKSGNNSGQTINLTVELRQGSTVIASMTHTNIPGVSGSGWQQGSFALTGAQGNAITNFADLRIRFRPEASGSGQKRSAQVSWAEVEFPSVGDPATYFTYGYDRLDRLTSVTGADGPRSYAYDPVGNRLTKVAGSTTTYTYDRADRILTAGGTATTVDANGNLTAHGTDTYGYDQANRMTSATVGGSSETYVYDGDGLRFKRQVGANPPIRYVSDVARGLPVLLDDGTRKYIYGLGLAYTVSGAAMKVYHPDRLGSVRVLTDPAGAITDRYRTDEWGIPTLHTGSSPQPFGYTGEPVDATGLMYLRARYYSPGLARFMSRDTWPGVPAMPQTLNRSSYVTGNPVTYRDPSGHAVVVLDLKFGPEKRDAHYRNVMDEQGGGWGGGGGGGGGPRVPGVGGGGPVRSTRPLPPGHNPQTWELRPASRPSEAARGNQHWYDPAGGEWRWHGPDRYHATGHWDYKPPSPWNAAWEKILR